MNLKKERKKLRYKYIVEYYSAIKNEIVSFAGKWMELEIIVLFKTSQNQKDKYGMFSIMQNPDP
jgi:hypothetical protein